MFGAKIFLTMINGFRKKKKKNKLKERIKGESGDTSGNHNETNVTAPDEKHPEAIEITTKQSDENDAKLSNNE